MPDRMNHDDLFLVKKLINNAVLTHTEFIQPNEVTRQSFQPGRVQISSQPVDALNDATADRLV